MGKWNFGAIIVLQLSLLCMTYIPNVNIVVVQIIIYALLLCLYLFGSKNTLFTNKNTALTYFLSLIFILFLFARIFIDLEVNFVPQKIYTNESSVYLFFINIVLLPMLFVPLIDIKQDTQVAYYVVAILVLICLFISFNNIIHLRGVMSKDLRFGGNELLGTIQYGHLGVTAFILGLSFMQSASVKFKKIIALLLISIGIISIFFAGTKGAFFSLFCCLLFYSYCTRNMKYIIIACFGVGLVFILKEVIVDYFSFLGSYSLERIFDFFTEEGDKSSGRIDLYRQALNDFKESPIFGKAYFFTFNGQPYVHNSFLEVARALGIVGVVLFLIINVKCLLISQEVLKHKTFETFFALLYIQYFSYSLLSETLVRLNMYWLSMAVLLCVKHSYDKNINLDVNR